MFTTDEEIGGQNGVKYLLDNGYKCQFFVTCEPSRLNIVYAHKGLIWAKVKVKGVASHASRPWDGTNASLKAYEGLSRLYKIYPLPKKEAWRTTINVGYISGGDAFNRVMSECEVKLDIRFIEKDSPNDIISNIKKCFPGAQVEIVEKESGMDTPAGDKWVRQLAASVKRIAGKSPELKKGHGACDGRFYSAMGIPAVEFGTPAHGLHTDEEYVLIKPLETFYKILWDFVSCL
jgi:succinyl-diaminopimelate desuccinylase